MDLLEPDAPTRVTDKKENRDTTTFEAVKNTEFVRWFRTGRQGICIQKSWT